MKKLLVIAIALLWKVSGAQDSCRPHYPLLVQTLAVTADVPLAYVEKGTGSPLLFIHGLGGNASHWMQQVEDLSHTYHCIAVDLPGYGWSDAALTNENQLDFYASVLSAFIREKGLAPVVLAGHSMGGQIALLLTLAHPEQVASVVLAAPAGLETFSAGEKKAMLAFATPAYFARQDERAIRAAIKQNFSAPHAALESMVQERLRLKGCPGFSRYTETVVAGIKGMLDHPVKARLAEIKKPVLILFGSDDALIPNTVLHPALQREAFVRAAAAAMPAATVVTVPGAGHLLQMEKGEAVTKAIKTFLK